MVRVNVASRLAVESDRWDKFFTDFSLVSTVVTTAHKARREGDESKKTTCAWR